MKKHFLTTVGLFFIVSQSFSQSEINQDQFWTLTRVYGAIKYYDNEKDDSYLDKEIVAFFPKMKNAEYSNEDFNADLINLFPVDQRTMKPNAKLTNPFDQFEGTDHKRTVDFSWIDEDKSLSEKNRKLLWQLICSHKRVKNSNVKKEGTQVHKESELNGSDKDTDAYFLGIIKCWNVLEYSFPYKPLMDASWDSVYYNSIADFETIKNEEEYVTILHKLTANLDDSHVSVEDKQATYSSDVSKLPFSIVIAEKKLIIKSINDSLSHLYHVQTGDVIEKLNEKTFDELWDEYSELFAYSTPQAGVDDFKIYLWHYCNNNDSTIQATIKSNSGIHNERIKTIELKDFLKLRPNISHNMRFRSIDDKTGYIQYDGLSYAELGKATRKLKHKKYLILDLRGHNYGLSSLRLINFMGNKKVPVSKFYKPNYQYPGIYNNPRIIRYRIWPKFNRTYKGKVIALINEENMCAMESLIMAIDARRPDAVLIGSPTQGCNGGLHFMELPGDQKVWFTGQGDLQYPDGSQFQRIGIQPDIFVEPTVESVRDGEDLILNKAIEYIESINQNK